MSILRLTQIGAGVLPLALVLAGWSLLPTETRADKPSTVTTATAATATADEKCPFPGGWKPPADVTIPPGSPIPPFVPFDTFSWDTFISLNWPAKQGQRGVPNQAACIGDKADSVVWETFADAAVLFQQNPPPWDGGAKALSGIATFRDTELKSTKTVKRFSKISPAGIARIQAAPDDFDFNQAFSSPLIDQNGNYAVYEVRFDKTAYNFVLNGQFYLRKNLPLPPTGYTNGSTVVKAGWRVLTAADLARKPVRYYHTEAMVYDPDLKKDVLKPIGLIGFHIMVKTPSRPQWIWATFEQVDNVSTTVAGLKPSFNNGTPNPPTPKGFSYKPPQLKGDPLVFPPKGGPNRQPVQVTRIPQAAIPAQTVPPNAKYQALLNDTPFEFYQLTHSQWPSDPSNVQQFGVPFPSSGVTNSVQETYLQTNSCMTCHAGAAAPGPSFADFSWTLSLNALPPPPKP